MFRAGPMRNYHSTGQLVLHMGAAALADTPAGRHQKPVLTFDF